MHVVSGLLALYVLFKEIKTCNFFAQTNTHKHTYFLAEVKIHYHVTFVGQVVTFLTLF